MTSGMILFLLVVVSKVMQKSICIFDNFKQSKESGTNCSAQSLQHYQFVVDCCIIFLSFLKYVKLFKLLET